MSVYVHADVDGAVLPGGSRRRTADELGGRLRQQPVGCPATVANPRVTASSHGRLHVSLWFEQGAAPAAARGECERRLRAALAGWRDGATVRVWS